MDYIAHYLRPTVRGGQIDELRKTNFRTKLREKPRFSTIPFFSPYLMASHFSSSINNRLISVSYESPFFKKSFQMQFTLSLDNI